MWTLFIMSLNWPSGSMNDCAYSYLFWIPAGVRWGFTVLFAHWTRPFLKFQSNVLHGMPATWARLWSIFLLWKNTSLFHPFKSSGMCFILLPNPDFLGSLGASLPMIMCICLYLLHNLQILALLTLNFSLICPINLWPSLPFVECPLISIMRTSDDCMSFLPCLRFW